MVDLVPVSLELPSVFDWSGFVCSCEIIGVRCSADMPSRGATTLPKPVLITGTIIPAPELNLSLFLEFLLKSIPVN